MNILIEIRSENAWPPISKREPASAAQSLYENIYPKDINSTAESLLQKL